MKTLILILLLNAQTGDLDGYYVGGITANFATCHDAQVKALADGLSKQIPEGDLAYPLCLDVSKVDIQGLQHQPTTQPPTVSQF